jgi:hypothetical protein
MSAAAGSVLDMNRTLLVTLCLAAAPAAAKSHPKAAPAKAETEKKADPLLSFSVTLKPQSYLSLHTGKVYSEAEAPAHKADLDFVYLVNRDDGNIKRELYNLSGKDTKLPAEVLGTKAGIVALGWDDDLVAKCVSVADLKRMTGSYTANSFSFYGTLGSSKTGEIENKRFIFTDAQGRMGFFTAKLDGDDLQLDIKITP